MKFYALDSPGPEITPKVVINETGCKFDYDHKSMGSNITYLCSVTSYYQNKRLFSFTDGSIFEEEFEQGTFNNNYGVFTPKSIYVIDYMGD